MDFKLFGLDLTNILIPPSIRSGGTATMSLKEVLVGNGGVIPYYTQLLTSVAAFVSFIYIVISGYQMLTAFGDEAKYTQGKKTLQFAIIGFVISLSAFLIIKLFVALLGYSGELPT